MARTHFAFIGIFHVLVGIDLMCSAMSCASVLFSLAIIPVLSACIAILLILMVVLLLWHSSAYSPNGSYLHHSPHFEEKHEFHFPAYDETLLTYEKVVIAINTQ